MVLGGDVALGDDDAVDEQLVGRRGEAEDDLRRVVGGGDERLGGVEAGLAVPVEDVDEGDVEDFVSPAESGAGEDVEGLALLVGGDVRGGGLEGGSVFARGPDGGGRLEL